MMQPQQENTRQFLRTIQDAESFLCSIWTRLRQAREERGWSMEKTAEQIGVDDSTYKRWEQKRHRPQFAHLVTLLETFGIHALTSEREQAFLKFLAHLDATTREALLHFLAEMDTDDFSWMRQLIRYAENAWPPFEEKLSQKPLQGDERP